MNTTATTPMEAFRLPRLLSLPIRLVPNKAHGLVITRILNHIFNPELGEGELDFLADRVILVKVDDAGLELRLTLDGERLAVARTDRVHDLSIEGSVFDFLLLASRREDPDTLFFNRRLRLGGNTELGLYVKNFLDAWEPSSRLTPLLKALDHATTTYERLGKLRLKLPF